MNRRLIVLFCFYALSGGAWAQPASPEPQRAVSRPETPEQRAALRAALKAQRQADRASPKREMSPQERAQLRQQLRQQRAQTQ